MMSSYGNTFRSGYKKRSFCFGNNDGKRVLRADKINEDRKDRRRNAFQTQRNIVVENSPADQDGSTQETSVLKEVPRNVSRLEALKRWKKEKENRQKVLKKIEKPVFKVSVVKHKVYSPPVCFCNKENCKSALCAEAKLKVKREDKLISCATPQISRKPNLLSSSQKKNHPVVDSGRARRLQPHLEKQPFPLTPRLPPNVKKDDKVAGFATPKLTRKQNQPSSSRKNVLPKVDSGRVKRVRPQVEDVKKPAVPAQLTSPGVDQPVQRDAQHAVESLGNNEVDARNCSGGESVPGMKTMSKLPVPSDSKEECGASEQSGAALELPFERTEIDDSKVSERPKLEPGSMLNENKHAHQQFECVSVGVTVTDKDLDDMDYPAMHSPYITVTRGKNRSETKKRGCSSPGVFSSTPTRYLQNLSNMLSALDEGQGVHGVKYFRLKLKMELGMLHGLCDYWSAVQRLGENGFDDYHDLIDSAVGQCNLLMTKKMAQFETLITNCEQHSGEKPVTVDDLQGFWDVMYMQVVDVRKRFYNLEELYLNGGQKSSASSKKKNTRKSSRNKKAAENDRPKIEAKSSMRAVIAAARKKQKEDSCTRPDTSDNVILSERNAQPVPRTPSRVTPRARSASLHQQVLVRESRRKTVTWDTVSPSSSNTEESLSVPTPVATPKSVLKKKLLAVEKEKSDERPKDVSSVHFEEAELRESPDKVEYSVTPYVRRSRRSRYSSTPKNPQVPDDLIGFETPTEEPARVRRSKRLNSTGH